MHFKYYFNHLSNREKVIFFMTVPLILFLLFTFIDKYFINNKKDINKQIKTVKKLIKNNKQKKIKPSNIFIIKSIEKIAKHFEIQILNININQKDFELVTTGKYSNTINFINSLEQNMKIKVFKLKYKDDMALLESKWKMGNIFVQESIKTIDNIPNPFIQTRNYINHSNQNTTLILEAIVDTMVCINSQWYNKDDEIQGYKIVEILKNNIILQKGTKIIKLKIHNDT